MRLSDFIRANVEPILKEWEEFAASIVIEGQSADRTTLRDHAQQMLETIALNLAQPETEHEEIKKSTGKSDSENVEKTAATRHGIQRLALGFSLVAAMAEYRALRASVTRLWQKSQANQPETDNDRADLIRFNEAVDQSINESVTSYSNEKESQMRAFDTILSALPGLNFVFMLDRKLSYVNKAAIELFALPVDKLIGKNFIDIGLPNGPDLQNQIDQVIKTKKQSRGEMYTTLPSGNKQFYDYIFVPTFGADGMVEAVACTANNVTERRLNEDRNWRRANYDLLTGLPNRRLFLDHLERNMKNSARVGGRTALLFIDLDHFKQANDEFGHDVGDDLLRQVTDRLRSSVREADMVARMGGDEFTVVLQDLADTKYVALVAENILNELEEPFQIFNNTVHISASIGIALYPQDACTLEELIRAADQAMYIAKNAGSNQLSFYFPTIPQAVAADRKLTH